MVQTTNGVPGLIGPSSDVGDRPDLRAVNGDWRRNARDVDGALLRELRRLSTARVSEADLIDGVKRARAGGWNWTPIAIALDSSRAEVIRRFGRGIGHPSARRNHSVSASTGN